jgi:asparagine synthase (glutamine-hydrolysing)
MCGIYGRWALDGRPLAVQAVQAATTVLRHRGPDDEGFLLANLGSGAYVHAGGDDTPAEVAGPRIGTLHGGTFDLALGFRRLSILDLSPLGHQPMTCPRGRYTIVYNGEVYNYRELREELVRAGHRFRGGSDTEVVLAAYCEWGPACLSRFNGMWAFAVWDAREERLFLSRDRFGIKPLYYVSAAASFAFASEIKALVGRHGIPFRPDEGAVYRYLESAHLPGAQDGGTFFGGVAALPPAHFMVVDRAGVRTDRYYELPQDGCGEVAAPGEVVRGYRDLFDDAVKLRLRSDVPVGSCLSGGVDSSAIVCTVTRLISQGLPAEQVGERQKTFSAVYHTEGRYNERAQVETVLAASGAERNFVFPTADGLRDDLPRLVWHQDEPFNSTSIYAQWCVMRAVRERGVTVLLDGQGADEMLAGYRPFDVFTADLIRRGELARALGAGLAIRQITGMAATPLLARALVRQLPNTYLAEVRRRRALRATHVMRSEFAAAHRAVPRYAPVARHMHAYLRGLIQETSLPHLLRYEDRNTMAFSVEGRVPFLDYRLVEYSLKQAFRLCIHEGWTKWVLREAMRGQVPDPILWRRDKVGFETPEREWIGAWLAAAGAEYFGPDARSAPYLDGSRVRRKLAGFHSGAVDLRQAWRWINLEAWLRAFG